MHHIGPEPNDLRARAPVLVPTDATPTLPPVTMANAGGGEAEKAPEPADMGALVAEVSFETAEWVKDVKATVVSTATADRRANFAADVERLEAAASLFRDTPDDLRELR